MFPAPPWQPFNAIQSRVDGAAFAAARRLGDGPLTERGCGTELDVMRVDLPPASQGESDDASNLISPSAPAANDAVHPH
jgi:hypothetical protein